MSQKGQLTFETLSQGNHCQVVNIINSYTADWPYCRAVGSDLIAYWYTVGDAFQPKHILVARDNGEPVAFVHGQRCDDKHIIHLLAVAPGAIDGAVDLLDHVEQQAVADGLAMLHGPHFAAGLFYGGYLLGREPYHPHWADDSTQAYVRAGFHISHPGVLLIADLNDPVAAEDAPNGYEVVEADVPGEFEARKFSFVARHGQQQVSAAGSRLYSNLLSPCGKPVGQIGHVNTEPLHRGKGLARILTKRCLYRLRKWGAAEALITTGFDNYPALRAYERAGFCRRYSLNEWSKSLCPKK